MACHVHTEEDLHRDTRSAEAQQVLDGLDEELAAAAKTLGTRLGLDRWR